MSQFGTDVGDPTAATPEQTRAACIVLAGKALDAADGDWDTARTILRPALEAIGAVPYDSAARGAWGRPIQLASGEGDDAA